MTSTFTILITSTANKRFITILLNAALTMLLSLSMAYSSLLVSTMPYLIRCFILLYEYHYHHDHLLIVYLRHTIVKSFSFTQLKIKLFPCLASSLQYLFIRNYHLILYHPNLTLNFLRTNKGVYYLMLTFFLSYDRFLSILVFYT